MCFLLIATVIWSFSLGLIGNHLAGLPPAWLAAVRLLVAAAVFLPFAQRVPLRTGAALFGIGMVQFGIMSLAYMSSFRYLKSHEVALFTVMTPVYVVLFNDLFTRKFHAVNLLAAILSVCGATAILWKGVSSAAPLIGFLLVELSNLCFALGQLLYRELLKSHTSPAADRRLFFWLYLGGLAALLPLGLHDAVTLSPRPSLHQWAVILYLGTLVSGVSYFLWNTGARRVAAGTLAVMNNLKLPLSVAVSLLIFGEKTSVPNLLAGGLLIVAALLPPLFVKSESEKESS